MQSYFPTQKMHLLTTHQVCKSSLFPISSMIISTVNLPNFRVCFRVSLPIHRLCSHSSSSSSSTPNPLSIATYYHSFTSSYLKNSCGLSPEEAFSVSQIVNIEAPEKPDSVLDFLKKHEFTKTQISKTVKRYPQILFCDPEETLLPKFEFLTSIGLSNTDIARGITAKPKVWMCSLENHIIPFYNFYRQWLQSDEKTVSAIKLCPLVLFYDPQINAVPLIQHLKEIGMPDSNIMFFFRENPRCFLSTRKVKKIAEKVTKMGFDPLGMKFVGAINVLTAMGKSTWKRKVELYKKRGFSEDEISMAFRRCPKFMMAAEGKIMGIFDILVNDMGLKASIIAKRPQIFTLNLEKTIIPRCLVYRALLKRGLVDKNQENRLLNLLCMTETRFTNSILKTHEEKFPQLMKLYQGKVVNANGL